MARDICTETVSVKSNSLAKNPKKTKHSVETKNGLFPFKCFPLSKLMLYKTARATKGLYIKVYFIPQLNKHSNRSSFTKVDL